MDDGCKQLKKTTLWPASSAHNMGREAGSRCVIAKLKRNVLFLLRTCRVGYDLCATHEPIFFSIYMYFNVLPRSIDAKPAIKAKLQAIDWIFQI